MKTPYTSPLRVLTVVGLAMFAILCSGCASSFKAPMGSFSTEHVDNLGPEVNSDANDYAPAFRQNRMLFTSDRPTIEGYIQGDDFWFSDLERAGWSRSLNWGAGYNSNRDEGAAWFYDNGKRVVFVQSWTSDGLGDADLYEADMDTYGKMVRIRNLGDLNSAYWDSQPFVNRAGTELFFCSDRPGGEGKSDLYVSKKTSSGKWGKPVNLGPAINSGRNEKSPSMTPNDSLLFFASDGWGGYGGYDLFVTKREKKGWGKVINVGEPLSSVKDDMFLRIAPREDTVFLASNRGGGEGGLDLYACWPNPFKDTMSMKLTLVVTVADSATQTTMPNARVTITGAEDRFTGVTTTRGTVSCRVEKNETYDVLITAPGYTTKLESVTPPQSYAYKEYRRTIYLGKIPATPDTVIVAEKTPEDAPRSIAYFDFNEYVIRADALKEIQEFVADQIAPLKGQLDGFEVRLDAHTDEKGTEEYNIQLSRRRGEAVIARLRELGVPVSMITMTPHGETLPVSREADEKAWRMNRRVEIVLVPPRVK